MSDSKFGAGRAVALLVGTIIVGFSFFLATAITGTIQSGGSSAPLWWSFSVPIGLLVVGVFLMAFATSALTLGQEAPQQANSPSAGRSTRVLLRMSLAFLTILGCGLSVMGLVASSTFFYGCGSAGVCIEMPVESVLLQFAYNLSVSGIVILSTAVVPLLLLYVSRRRVNPFVIAHDCG